MLDKTLRPVKDRLLAPLALALVPRLPPAALTAAGLAIGLAAAGLAWHRWYAAALVCWLANRLLDGLDGILARVSGQASDRGGYFDLLSDFVVYALIPIGLAAGRPADALYAPVAWLLASFYVNALSWMYIAAVLERRGDGASRRGEPTSVTMPEAVIGGTETLFFYSLFLLFPGQLQILILLMAVLTTAGAAQRTFWVWRHL